MAQHYFFFIIFILFIDNVSSTVYNTRNFDTSDITTNIVNVTKNVKSNLFEEQTKIYTELYNGQNLEKITTSGSYLYKGEINTSITIQKNSGIVHLYFENADFSNPGVKIIDSKKGVNLVITLIGENTILNPSETSSNAISINQDITINGQGSLTIVSSKNGIKCDGKFYGLGGILTIRANNHGISADSLYLDGININILETGSGKDGLHAETDYDIVSEVPSFDFLKGFISIQSGTINIENCTGDGIQTDSFLYISNGNVNIQTKAIWETFTATSNHMKGCFSKKGDTYTKVPTDNVRRGKTYYILKSSCKGIKVGEIDYYMKNDETQTEQTVSSSYYTILIEGGNININSADDSIHTNSGSTLIYGGKIKISTLDDGISADLNLIVKGGDINIETCFEGLEAQYVEVQGGSVKIIADDDGINARGGREAQLVFSGGKTYVYAKGDGLDSNGDMIINDGEVYVIQSGGGNGPLDTDGEIVVNGGKLVAAGSSGMPGVPSGASRQCAIVRQISPASGDISLRNSGGESILEFKISSVFGVKVSYALVTLSSSLIKQCNSYEILTGESANSLITSGSSTVTSNVRAGGHGPGGPWGGPERPEKSGDPDWPWGGPDGPWGGPERPEKSGDPDRPWGGPGGPWGGPERPEKSGDPDRPWGGPGGPDFGGSNNDGENCFDSSHIDGSSRLSGDDGLDENLPNNKKGVKLSKGLIIGIAVAGAAVVALVVTLLVYFLVIRRKRNARLSNEEELFPEANENLN